MPERFSKVRLSSAPPTGGSAPSSSDGKDDAGRTEFERDFDRILFCAPLRRLADKTQVFPLEKNDSVRTRLTHTHEVANLCRSLATQILRKDASAFGEGNREFAPTIAAAAGLAHDLGNPPFGHQGEFTIRRWFRAHSQHFKPTKEPISGVRQSDFEEWEGNAQTLRLLTRLQVAKGFHGLDLTSATLAATMKYTVDSTSHGGKTDHPARKKTGFFEADASTAKQILENVGITSGQRHPLAYVMEACNDIAYSVIDIEDAIKKGLISINDVVVAIEKAGDAELSAKIKDQADKLRTDRRPSAEINDIGAQYYRTFSIHKMVHAVAAAYLSEKDAILLGSLSKTLIDTSSAKSLYDGLKEFASEHAYNAPAVKEIELRGDQVLCGLLDYFWRGIEECSVRPKKFRELANCLRTPDPTPFGEFVYSHISRNYMVCFESSISDKSLPGDVRYHQLLLLTDMISGMTDSFALDLFRKFRSFDDGRK